MRKQETQQGANVELANSVKALKLAILQAQHAVAADGNRVMLMLYLGIGRFVSQKTRKGVWGTGAIEAISEQLQREMPGLRGFSGENIKKMRHFYEAWEGFLIRSPVATEFPISKTSISSIKCSPTATDLPDEKRILTNWSIQHSVGRRFASRRILLYFIQPSYGDSS